MKEIPLAKIELTGELRRLVFLGVCMYICTVQCISIVYMFVSMWVGVDIM